MCPAVMRKSKLVSNKLGYLAKVISKQSIENVAWCGLTAYSKMKEEEEKLREIVGKKRQKMRRETQPAPIAKDTIIRR